MKIVYNRTYEHNENRKTLQMNKCECMNVITNSMKMFFQVLLLYRTLFRHKDSHK